MDFESRYTARFAVVFEPTLYDSQETAQETVGRCVTIDTRRRYLLFCIIQNHYANFRNNHRTAHPLHRKLQLSAYVRIQLGNEDLIAKLDEQFGVEAVYVIGNWSAPNTRFHEPIRGLGFRRLLRKAGEMVYLIDEFRTSQCCPAYEIFG
ncbi:hypothetical protein INT47_004302 [Mucor saturninus]|uniref:Uncharacterized protein n=1 Tax=Mucor saturninus TaxID=64648 RepID=A0A8H7RC28_9FUNG|nr:hypothetical protein INT47_004302 [Mucor saturninus]